MPSMAGAARAVLIPGNNRQPAVLARKRRREWIMAANITSLAADHFPAVCH
jgi:hypothetical protein